MAYITPKVLFLGSICSVTICFCTGAMSIHGAYNYIQQSRVAQVTVSAMTVFKLVCCAPAAFLSDDMFLRTQQALAENRKEDYGNIADKKRVEKRRKKKARTESPKETKEEMIYEEFDPYVRNEQLEQKGPSAPGPRTEITGNAPCLNDIPFVYPTILPTTCLHETIHPTTTDNPPAYPQPDYSTQ